MRSLVRLLFAAFLSTSGIAVFAALDATIFFWFPFGIDAAVILMVIRHRELAWLYPLLVTAGSLAGCAATYWMGAKLGEAELERHISKRRLASVKSQIRERGAMAVGTLAIIPPPFPFTAFVLASGALEVDRTAFLVTVGSVRVFRFGVEAALAAKYGSAMISWLDSDLLQAVVVGCILLAIVISLLSLYTLIRRGPVLARSAS